MVKSEILLYLQTKMKPATGFKDAGTKHETPAWQMQQHKY